ncbi:C40 family peptidase [Streptacidiphilus sp. PB12-B1b]|uniref:C40 family peptidase n=1 Tax=Streptacidiphilus sp. PB12-B1b TaxID=2705012 RepID=UPI0015F8435B|nr:C40 family peptidase [Streptacidiphilus sp. PB12-B1b]QMU79014.1 C40 family peptidase [Streptacidiphilus sp. PB12-B1b]
MKKTLAGLTLVACGPLLLAAPVLFASSGVAAASCASGAQAVDTSAVAAEVQQILAGGKASGVSVPGLDDPSVQLPNAVTITATGLALHVPARGQVVALATALQESGLRNLDSGDRDSLGLFQQRPSQGWGSAEQIMQPVYASTRFYQALLQVPGWQSLTVTQAAQAVQQSAYPDAYAKWEPLATALQQAIAPRLSADTGTTPSPSASASASGSPSPTASAGATASTASVGGCATDDDGSGFGPIPAGSVPSGYTIPATAPAQVQTALRWAMGQLGTEYQWGGDCTNPHGSDAMGRCDCSSLVQQAYRAAGVTLERTTFQQVTEGTAVSVDALQPGDLVFTAGTDGTAAEPGHVGIYMGSGLIINAPHTGAVVSIDTLASWKSEIVAARRVV